MQFLRTKSRSKFSFYSYKIFLTKTFQIFPSFSNRTQNKNKKVHLPVSHPNKVLMNSHPQVMIQIQWLTPSLRGYPAALAPFSGRFEKTPRALHFNLIIEANRRLASQSAVLRQQTWGLLCQFTLDRCRSLVTDAKLDGCFATACFSPINPTSLRRDVSTQFVKTGARSPERETLWSLALRYPAYWTKKMIYEGTFTRFRRNGERFPSWTRLDCGS